MDPLSIATQRFHAQLRACWQPLAADATAPLLRIVAEATYRTQMVKALRLAEWQLDNRRPFFIVEDEPTPDVIRQQLVNDFEALRLGLTDDGVEVAALRLDDTSGMPALLAVLEQISSQLEGVAAIDGLVLAIVHPQGMATEVSTGLSGWIAARVDDAVRLLAWDADESPADGWPIAAAFTVDGLWEQLGQGRRSSTHPAAGALNELLLEAGHRHQEGNAKAAARKLHSARSLCRMEGLGAQQAACSLAIGASICGHDERGALTAFKDAKALAEAQGQPAIAVQALLGAAAVHLQASRQQDAANTYAAAELAALAAALPPLQRQAQRMRTLCEQTS